MRRSRGGQILAIILFLSMGLVGCRSALIPPATKNPIPSGMSLEDVRLLIALSIDGSVKANCSTTPTPSHKVMKELFAISQTDLLWTLDNIETKTIRATYSIRKDEFYSVSLHIHFSETEWWIAIVDGRNLGFNGERIHKNALVWVGNLEQKIRQKFNAYQILLKLNQ